MNVLKGQVTKARLKLDERKIKDNLNITFGISEERRKEVVQSD